MWKAKGRAMMKLQGPADVGSVSVAGQEFQAVNGVVEVPEELAEQLASFGFYPWVEPAATAKLAMPTDKPKFTPPTPPAESAA
jgi:hypothetical protein